MADDPRATLIKLVDALRELETEYQAKRESVLAEMATLLRGGEGIGPKITRLKAQFQDCWAGRYHGQKYIFANHAMVGASIKRWLLAGYKEHEIAARFFSYVKSEDPFYVRTRHSFEVCVKAFNQLAGLPQSSAEDAATMERQREMRGQA